MHIRAIYKVGAVKFTDLKLQGMNYWMAYNIRIRTLFTLYGNHLDWRFPDGGGLVKSDYLIPLFKVDLSFYYHCRKHIQEITSVRFHLCL